MTTTSKWKQPAPRKPFAIYFDGAWYGEGDTIAAAWGDVRCNLSPQHDRYGSCLFSKIKTSGKVVATKSGELK